MADQYKSILKATSIFGGTQVIQILVNLLKSKFVAVLIGSVGMGLHSIYMSTTTLIITIFGLGLNTSVVRDLSKFYDKGQEDEFAKVTIIFRRILFSLVAIGVIIIFIFSKYLSQWAFSSEEHSNDFRIMSLVFVFTLLSQGNTAVLISSRKIKLTALCTLLSSVMSLITSIPFFYYLRLDGVVPGLAVSSFFNYIITYYYSRKIKIKKINCHRDDYVKYGKRMITLGIAMVLTVILSQATIYLLNICITRLGGISDLGLFNAGMALTTQSIVVIFSALAADYYPRLVAAMDNTIKMNETINQQSEIILYLSVPILAIFLIISPLIIRLLLSTEFLTITYFVRILCFGMLMKCASYAYGYVAIAKGDKKAYFFIEGLYGNAQNLILSVCFYYFWGLIGLAISFVVNYILYYNIIKLFIHKRYSYEVNKNLTKLMLMSIVSLGFILALSYTFQNYIFFLTGGVITLIICIFYLKELDKRTHLLKFILNKFK